MAIRAHTASILESALCSADAARELVAAIDAGGGAAVSSVAGRTGAVTLAYADIAGLGTAAQHPAGDFALVARGLPAGGTTGQVLAKSSGTDYAAGWGDAAGGMAIGGAISGGTAGRVPFEGASHVLADSANLTYVDSPALLSVAGTSVTASLGEYPGYPPYAAFLLGATPAVYGTAGHTYIGGADVTIITSGFIVYVQDYHVTLGWGTVCDPTTDVMLVSFRADWSPCGIQGIASQTAPLVKLLGISSTSTARAIAYINAGFTVSTDASYTGYLSLSAQDFNATSGGREGIRIGTDGTQPLVGLYANVASPVAQGAAIVNATTAVDVITQFNLLLAYLRSRGDIAT